MGGPSGNQAVLRGAPQDSLITLGTSLGICFPDNPADFLLFVPVCSTTWIFQGVASSGLLFVFLDFGIE